jgi:hypothetical protein
VTPAQFQEICIEAEDIRHDVQEAYRRKKMADGDAKDILHRMREIRLLINQKGTNNEPDQSILHRAGAGLSG